MDLQEPLAELVNNAPGAVGAILVDNDGESVVVYARPAQSNPDGYAGDERIRLIGAYHTISLRDADQLWHRFDYGETDYLVHRYEAGTVITKPLKGGYALMLVLESESYVGRAMLYVNRAATLIGEDL